MNGLKVFAGTSGQALTEKITRYLDIPVGRASVGHFPDGEILIKLDDDVRGRDCFVVQSTCPPVNHSLMELLIFSDCLRRASARRITAVVPYFGYARQDRKTEGRTPITAKLVANMIAVAGADRVLTMDLHADQIQGFFDIPLDHLMAEPVITKHFSELNIENFVTVSPDVGHMKTANTYASRLGGDIAVIDKRRKTSDSIEMVSLIGSVEDRDVLIFDDMITTAGTVCGAAEFLRKRGARSITVAATHPIFAGSAVDRILDSPIDKICVSDTVPLSQILSIGLDHLMAEPVITKHFSELNIENFVTVSPDVGHMKTANTYASRLGGDIAVIDKRRKTSDSIEMVSLIGSVEDRDVLIFDDMITTAGTVCGAAEFLRKRGARSITVAATHPIFAGSAVDRILDSPIDKICVSDTVPLSPEAEGKLKNITVLSVAELMGEAIRRIHRNESVSALFDDNQ